MRRRAPFLVAAAAVLLAACQSFPAMKTPPVVKPRPGDEAMAVLSPKNAGAPVNTEAPATPDQIVALASAPGEKIDAELPPQPLPQMLNTVFGDLLKVPYVLGPDVGGRTETITLRGVGDMTKRDFAHMAEVALRDYALKVVIRGGVANIVDDPNPNISAATYLSRRPSQDTPQSAAIVTQFYEAKAIDIQALLSLLADVNPGARALSIEPDVPRNSVVITGRARDVAAALGMLQELDQPLFAGVGVVRMEPVYWSAETLATQLQNQMRSDGVLVSGSPQDPHSVVIVAYPDVNQVLLFAKDPAVLAEARDWGARLDQPSAVGNRPTTFIYQAQNTDAKSLADVVQTPYGPPVLGGPAQSQATNPNPNGTPGGTPTMTAEVNAEGVGRATIGGGGIGASGGHAESGAFLGGRIIVDDAGNRILFTGQPDEYTELRKLLVALDTPQKQVLVEVTIAEVTLTDQTNIGMEWFFKHSMSPGSLAGGTLNGLGLGSQGLNLNYTASWAGLSVQAAFNAFASNNKVNILSRPRLVARSGSEASIQVGTDVPIITAQATSPTQTIGATNILQSIEYRQTGTILHIKPVVYGDDRIDLFITQEVSSQEANPNAAVASPIILDRNITTQLSLKDGATAVLGGLMDNEYTKGNSGIPILKDIPILGDAARTDAISGNKTELVVLVTPYVLRDGDMGLWAKRYGEEMNAAFRIGYGWSYTLTAYPPLSAVNGLIGHP